MAGKFPGFLALGVIVMNPFFVLNHNAMQKSLPSLPFKHCSQANKRRSTSLGFKSYGTNFLVSESFPWFSDVLKWLVESLLMTLPILHAFNTSLHEVMPSIIHL